MRERRERGSSPRLYEGLLESEREMKASSGPKLERTSSIESEPRTLSLEQLQLAREAALYVLSTKSIEEAINIFTEGLKPVLSIGSMGSMDLDISDEVEDLRHFPIEHTTLPLLAGLKDTVTAPF